LLVTELLKKESISKKGVYISTTGVYGNKNGKKTYETSRCNPTNNRSLRRLDAETKFRKLNFHILRVPGIYSINRLPLQRLMKKIPVLKREEDVYTNHIHESDLARVAYLALFRGRRSRITNVVDNSDLKMSDYMDLVASATGLEKPERASFAKLNQLAAKGLISNMAMSFLRDSRRVKSERLKKELRIDLIYPNVHEFVHKNRKHLSTIRQQTPSQ
jgi:nucleoside-diphosphate-sugar epimerase